jgi:hypothetical protein
LRKTRAPEAVPWDKRGMKHAAPEPRRRWFGLRRAARQPEPVIDLRAAEPVLPEDPETVVSRLARLRDAGLITNAEFEKERRTLLQVDEPHS